MKLPPAVIVHGVADARAVLALGRPVTLLSAPGAALYAGCLWWREVVAQARAAFPATSAVDILDCADASGQAMAALRGGMSRLVLWPGAPGWAAVAAIAAAQGGFVLPSAPSSLDLARPNAWRELDIWVRVRSAPRDSDAAVG
jgi:hypothetical protein